MSPGIRISGRVAPPRPLASITSTAATIGEPKITEIAAKLPAAAMIRSSCGGASRLASLTESIASAAPMAMSGASGPSTAPRPRVATAASTMPGNIAGSFPPTWSPCAGTCPPLPGRYRIARATGIPASPTTTGYHHDGRRRVAERVGQVAEHAELDLVHAFEEEPTGEGHDDADHRREDQQPDEVAAAKDRGGVGNRSGRVRRRRGRIRRHRASWASASIATVIARISTGSAPASISTP